MNPIIEFEKQLCSLSYESFRVLHDILTRKAINEVKGTPFESMLRGCNEESMSNILKILPFYMKRKENDYRNEQMAKEDNFLRKQSLESLISMSKIISDNLLEQYKESAVGVFLLKYTPDQLTNLLPILENYIKFKIGDRQKLFQLQLQRQTNKKIWIREYFDEIRPILDKWMDNVSIPSDWLKIDMVSHPEVSAYFSTILNLEVKDIPKMVEVLEETEGETAEELGFGGTYVRDADVSRCARWLTDLYFMNKDDDISHFLPSILLTNQLFLHMHTKRNKGSLYMNYGEPVVDIQRRMSKVYEPMFNEICREQRLPKPDEVVWKQYNEPVFDYTKIEMSLDRLQRKRNPTK